MNSIVHPEAWPIAWAEFFICLTTDTGPLAATWRNLWHFFSGPSRGNGIITYWPSGMNHQVAIQTAWETQLTIDISTITGWWFGTWMDYFSIQLGRTIPFDVHIFQRGRYTTNQYIRIYIYIYIFIYPHHYPNNSYLVVVFFSCLDEVPTKPAPWRKHKFFRWQVQSGVVREGSVYLVHSLGD